MIIKIMLDESVTLIGAARWMTWWSLKTRYRRVGMRKKERKSGGHICSDDHWTLSSKWLNIFEQTELNLLSSPPFCPFFLFAPSHRLVGEPDSTGNVSGRVSRCPAQTSAPRASAQWAGMGHIGFFFTSIQIVFEYPSPCVVSLKSFFNLLLIFLTEPWGVAAQIWESSSWNVNCTIHPCIRGL